MTHKKIHSCPELTAAVDQLGFLPLLKMGIRLSAEELTAEECQYTVLPDGGWEWPLWEWKGSVLRESGCAYGKFFDRKATFISSEWWPHFCNWRRSRYPEPEEGSIEQMVLSTLQEHGSLITRELRALCGFTGPKMRGKFDTYLSRLEMGCRIVTEDFVYPTDRHGRRYGWGWSLLTTPEQLFGKEACHPDRTPEASYERLCGHLRTLFPQAGDELFQHLLG